MVKDVLLFGHPGLRIKCTPVTDFEDPEYLQLVQDLKDTHVNTDNSAGFAAPQIGGKLRVFISDMSFLDEYQDSHPVNFSLDGRQYPAFGPIMPLIVVNPEVTVLEEGNLPSYAEGCLSIPDMYIRVRRPAKVQLDYQDEQGHPHVIITDGFFLKNICHETDHLDGILTTDRASPVELLRHKTKLKQLKRATMKSLKR